MIISAEQTRGVPSAELIEETRLVAVHHTVVRHDVAESGDEARETEGEGGRGEGDHQSR
jgi:hypothetical protein